MKRDTLFNKTISIIIIGAFLCTSIQWPTSVQAQPIVLPPVGNMLSLTQAFAPAMVRGLKVNPSNPFEFDFIIDPGDSGMAGDALKEESTKLVKYFLASLTVPESELWVNLSPYEENRIIPEQFGMTEMGRELLAQDYILKQITASLMYPEDGDVGAEFWERIREKSGIDEIPTNTFNKVWIVPEEAVVYEGDGVAYVVESRLKVMLEQDYLALNKDREVREVKEIEEVIQAENTSFTTSTSTTSSEVIREIILPVLEEEVNQGQHFAPLRQIYNSLILASWYKRKLKNSVLMQVYGDQNKTKGVTHDEEDAARKIYDQYVESFKVGVYDYIKEEYDPINQQIIPRKYFSGGMGFNSAAIDAALLTTNDKTIRGADLGGDNAILVKVALNTEDSAAMVDGQKIEVLNEKIVTLNFSTEWVYLEKENEIFKAVEDIYGFDDIRVDLPPWWNDRMPKANGLSIVKIMLEELVDNGWYAKNKNGEHVDVTYTIKKVIKSGKKGMLIEMQSLSEGIPDIPWAVKKGNTTSTTKGVGLTSIIDYTVFSFSGEVVIESNKNGYKFSSDKKYWGEDPNAIAEYFPSEENGVKISLWIPLIITANTGAQQPIDPAAMDQGDFAAMVKPKVPIDRRDFIKKATLGSISLFSLLGMNGLKMQAALPSKSDELDRKGRLKTLEERKNKKVFVRGHMHPSASIDESIDVLIDRIENGGDLELLENNLNNDLIASNIDVYREDVDYLKSVLDDSNNNIKTIGVERTADKVDILLTREQAVKKLTNLKNQAQLLGVRNAQVVAENLFLLKYGPVIYLLALEHSSILDVDIVPMENVKKYPKVIRMVDKYANNMDTLKFYANTREENALVDKFFDRQTQSIFRGEVLSKEYVFEELDKLGLDLTRNFKNSYYNSYTNFMQVSVIQRNDMYIERIGKMQDQKEGGFIAILGAAHVLPIVQGMQANGFENSFASFDDSTKKQIFNNYPKIENLDQSASVDDAAMVEKIDSTKIYPHSSQDKTFKLVEYFNQDILGENSVDQIPDMTEEYMRNMGRIFNVEVNDFDEIYFSNGNKEEFFKLVNKRSDDRDQLLFDIYEMYFDFGFSPSAIKNKDYGVRRIAWVMLNFMLLRNSGKAFYFTDEVKELTFDRLKNSLPKKLSKIEKTSSVSIDQDDRAAMVDSRDQKDDAALGGIDLNPANWELKTRGKQGSDCSEDAFDDCLKFDIPQEEIERLRISIDGLVPVIINVQPMINLPLFLGLSDELPGDADPYRTAGVDIGEISYAVKE